MLAKATGRWIAPAASTVCRAVMRQRQTLASVYLDGCRDRLDCDPRDAPSRRAVQHVLAVALRGLTAAVAPIAPHLAEDILQHVPPPLR